MRISQLNSKFEWNFVIQNLAMKLFGIEMKLIQGVDVSYCDSNVIREGEENKFYTLTSFVINFLLP